MVVVVVVVVVVVGVAVAGFDTRVEQSNARTLAQETSQKAITTSSWMGMAK